MEESVIFQNLKSKNINFEVHRFEYVLGGGTPRSSSQLGVSENIIIKTLVFETDQHIPLIVLMHGDKNVDTKLLAKQIGVNKIWSSNPEAAEALSGWPVGATNPFALKTDMKIFSEESIFILPRIFINGGGRGLLIAISPADLASVIQLKLVRCAKEKPVLLSKPP